MADTKISGLPASTTPLAGTEELPIVQSGVTRKVSVANLTAGRAISATELTLSTGNLIVASGQGIDFSATPGTGTSELLNDYEEGTFTPTIAGSGTSGTGTYTTQIGRYTKVGRTVSFQITLAWTNLTGATGILVVNGLPFTSANVTGLGTAVTTIADSVALAALHYMQNFVFANSTQVAVRQFPSGGGAAAAVGLATSGTIYLSGNYIV
jgi:hypothetical protein